MAADFWFQQARGRAMVRTARMREARYWAAVEGRTIEAQRDALMRSRYALKDRNGLHSDIRNVLDAAGVARLVGTLKRLAVESARRANKDWRTYRGYHEAENASVTL